MHISITVAAILFWNFNLTWSLNVTTTAIPETELVSVNRTELGIPPGENPGNETELVPTPTPIDPCAAGICQNGGTCIGNSSSTLGYECQCLEGWMGKNCTQSKYFKNPKNLNLLKVTSQFMNNIYYMTHVFNYLN